MPGAGNTRELVERASAMVEPYLDDRCDFAGKGNLFLGELVVILPVPSKLLKELAIANPDTGSNGVRLLIRFHGDESNNSKEFGTKAPVRVDSFRGDGMNRHEVFRRPRNESHTVAKKVGLFVGLFLPSKSVFHVGKHRHRRSVSL